MALSVNIHCNTGKGFPVFYWNGYLCMSLKIEKNKAKNEAIPNSTLYPVLSYELNEKQTYLQARLVCG